MNFTREEAKKDIAKTLSVQYRVTESTFNYVYNNIDKLSDSYEAQLKAKDTAIELLESMCNLGLETQNKYSRIVKAKDEEIEKLKAYYEERLDTWRSKIWNIPYYAETKKARSIVAMLFWEKRYKKRVFETWVKKHIDMPIGTSFRKGMVDEAEAIFERAYKMLKEIK